MKNPDWFDEKISIGFNWVMTVILKLFKIRFIHSKAIAS